MLLLAGYLMLIVGAFENPTAHEIEYAAQLRAQSLFRLSELQCRALLEGDELSEQETVRVRIELSKTLVARALNARPPEQDEFWRQAVATLESLEERALDAAQLGLVRMQKALTALQQAEWSRRVADVGARTPQDWQAARQLVRDAIRLLRDMEQYWQSPKMRAGSAGLSNVRVEELLRNTQYQLARAYRNQALTYPPLSKDRTNSLTLAVQYLQPISSSRVVDDIVWKSRLDRIECVRLLGELEQTRDLLNALVEIPDRYVGAVAAEGIRLALDAEQPEAAMRLVADQDVRFHPPELELARIETYVALASQEPDAERTRQYQAEASRLAALLGQDHGTYWGLRGEMLIARLAGEPDAGSSQAGDKLFDTAARTYLQRGLPDEAIKLFMRAARQADQQGDSELAFSYRNKAAVVEHQEGRLQPAVDRFKQAALASPDVDGASDAHLMAIFDAAALYQKHASRSPSDGADNYILQYKGLLAEHLRRWPQAASANQARIWAGRLAAAERDWQQAMKLFGAVGVGSQHAALANRELRRMHDAALKVGSREYDSRLKMARSELTTRLDATEDQAELAAVAATAARVHLLYTPADYVAGERILHAVARDAIQDGAEQDLVRALEVVSLVGKGDVQRATTKLNASLPLATNALVDLLKGLMVARDRRPHDTRFVPITREVLNLLLTYRTKLGPADQQLFRQCEADIAEPGMAKEIYQRLAADAPRDLRIQRRYAELLSLERDRQGRIDALGQWRALLRISRPQSFHWFRAKLGIAQAHFDQGQPGKAADVLQLVVSLYPSLAESGLQADYQTLLARCKD